MLNFASSCRRFFGVHICAAPSAAEHMTRRCHVALETPLQYEPRGSKQGLRNKTPQRLEHESFFRLNLSQSIIPIKDCCHKVWRYSVLWGLRCSGHKEIEVKEACARQFLRTKGLCSFSLGPS
eukprot:jgi/Botrbrau1/12318/Bobra.0205s0016.1